MATERWVTATPQPVVPPTSPPRRVRLAENLFQRLDRHTGEPVRGVFEYVLRDRDDAHHQHWHTATGNTVSAALAEQAQAIARLPARPKATRAVAPAPWPLPAPSVATVAIPVVPRPSDASPVTMMDIATRWLERGRGRTGPWAPPTRLRYERAVRRHIERSADPALPPLGSLRPSDVSVDIVAAWSAANERVLARTSARLTLLILSQICRFAVRRGWLDDNPVSRLEPGEKPLWRPGAVAILEADDLARVLDHAGRHRTEFEVMAYTGLRAGEIGGSVWSDVDFEKGILRVHRQLTRHRVHGPLKTDASRREVELAPAIVRLLREEWLASPFKGPDDFIFPATTGRGRDYRHVAENFRQAVRRSGVRAAGRLSLHSLRHGLASLLIAEGLDVVYVSRQLGHASPNVTLAVYAHLFARRQYAERAKQALEASHEAMTRARLGDGLGRAVVDDSASMSH